MKQIADDILKCNQNKEWLPYRVENIVRKGESACDKQFILFSQCFPQVYTCERSPKYGFESVKVLVHCTILNKSASTEGLKSF